MAISRFDVMKQFNEGFAAAVAGTEIFNDDSAHWNAGYSAGYRFRKVRHEELDKYLVSTGRKPQAVIRSCETESTP